MVSYISLRGEATELSPPFSILDIVRQALSEEGMGEDADVVVPGYVGDELDNVENLQSDPDDWLYVWFCPKEYELYDALQLDCYWGDLEYALAQATCEEHR